MQTEAQIFKLERPELEGGCEGAFWLVLSGAVKFYAEGDRLIATLKKHEGILIPRGFKYWFESAGEEPLEILRVAARDQGTENKRVNCTPLKPWQMERLADRA